MNDQAETLRNMVEDQPYSIPKKTRVISIMSGKGGVGKTNFAIALAIAFAQQGKKPIVIDVDMGLANVDIILNLNCQHTIKHLVEGICTLSEILYPGPEGIRIVPGASGSSNMADLSRAQYEHLSNEFTKLEQLGDILIFDTGTGIGNQAIRFATASDEAICLALPEPPSITDSYAMMKRLHREQFQGRLSFVLNMVENVVEARKVSSRFLEIPRDHLSREIHYWGHILQDDHVSLAVKRQLPFLLAYPKCHASICVQEIAYKILQGEMPPPRFPESGFFQRLSRLFR